MGSSHTNIDLGAPYPPQFYLLRGAGSCLCNGVYDQDGDSNSRPKFKCTMSGVHPGVTCDRTGECPIVGNRYKLIGHNYDICETEYDKLGASDKALYEHITPPQAQVGGTIKSEETGVGTEWLICHDGKTHYSVKSTTPRPPSDGWNKCAAGVAPAPSLMSASSLCLIRGAGTAGCDGVYYLDGETNGKPLFKRCNGAAMKLWWSKGEWLISNNSPSYTGGAYYSVRSSTFTPPTAGWGTCNAGTGPVPWIDASVKATLVGGAGSAACNGVYHEDGWSNGRPMFKNRDGGTIKSEETGVGTEWLICHNARTHYSVKSTTPLPPRDGWGKCAAGVAPAPPILLTSMGFSGLAVAAKQAAQKMAAKKMAAAKNAPAVDVSDNTTAVDVSDLTSAVEYSINFPPVRIKRWGDGLEAPAAGLRNFAPQGFEVTLDVSQAISRFGHSAAHVAQIMEAGRAKASTSSTPLAATHAAALFAYTEETPLYVTLNYTMRTPHSVSTPTDTELRQYVDYILHTERALSSLPTHVSEIQGKVYRGIKALLNPEIYSTGKRITWQGFSSSTKKQMATLDFVNVQPGRKLQGSIFVIDSITAKDIRHFSAIPSEEEVLFPPNSQFKVEQVLTSEQEKKAILNMLGAYSMADLDVYVLKQIA